MLFPCYIDLYHLICSVVYWYMFACGIYCTSYTVCHTVCHALYLLNMVYGVQCTPYIIARIHHVYGQRCRPRSTWNTVRNMFVVQCKLHVTYCTLYDILCTLFDVHCTTTYTVRRRTASGCKRFLFTFQLPSCTRSSNNYINNRINQRI